MITAKIFNATTPLEVVPPSLPFLWKTPSGCVYLRNKLGYDIIIAPNNCDEKLGKQVSGVYPLNEAWDNRLMLAESIILRNK
jgi:hypothetical protein